MRSEDESQLARSVLGDAEALRALRARQAAEPQLAAELDRHERAWNGLELPPTAPAPAGFAARTAAAAVAAQPILPGFTLSPVWAGLAAALLISAGVLGGAGLGLYALPIESSDGGDADSEQVAFWADDGLLDEQLFQADSPGDSAAAPSGIASGVRSEVAIEVTP